MIYDIDKHNPSSIAVIDDEGQNVTYGEICSFTKNFREALPKRTLVFILAQNNLGTLLGYLGCLQNKVVPLIISLNTDHELYNRFIDMYHPEYLWLPQETADNKGFIPLFQAYGYSLVKTGLDAPALFEDLSMLLPTSGSTGSPKLVRHSYRNLEANAENVKLLFQLTPNQRAMASLPIHYTMGRSVIDSHLKAGATILLSGMSLLDKRFWTRLKDERATSFTGVPYSYDLFSKLHFERMDLPDLEIITQGGGKLSEKMFVYLAKYAEEHGKKFIATYGQTECSARMTYLPYNLAKSKICSIGIAEPNSKLSIVDSEGVETLEGEATGEMVFRGENVTLGYATCAEDLAKGDENNGVMHTGDIAHRDEDGCYFIVGRMKRFLKIYGLRISLDEVENLIKGSFNVDCVCFGTDELLKILITKSSLLNEVKEFVIEKTHLFHKAIEVEYIEKIPRNEAGKVILHNN